MSGPPGPKEAAQRAMREARFAENAKITTGIRKAAAAGKEVLESRVKATAERMAKKPAKGKRRKK